MLMFFVIKYDKNKDMNEIYQMQDYIKKKYNKVKL